MSLLPFCLFMTGLCFVLFKFKLTKGNYVEEILAICDNLNPRKCMFVVLQDFLARYLPGRAGLLRLSLHGRVRGLETEHDHHKV